MRFPPPMPSWWFTSCVIATLKAKGELDMIAQLQVEGALPWERRAVRR